MSELTQCNYCSLQHYRAQAKHEKKKVTLMPGRPKFKGMVEGIDVFIAPAKVNVRELPVVQRRQYWVSWFMELSDHCVC